MPSLTEISIYPLKSAGAVALPEVRLDRFGPVGDRRWMLVDDNRRFLSQREDARLARIRAGLLDDALELEMDGAVLTVDQPDAAHLTEVTIWEDRVRAADAGDAAADWLSERLGRPLRLVFMPDLSHRYVDGRYATAGETVSFADGFPLLLISAASLDSLNDRLSTPVGMDRFRPNLVVEGCEPHAEDSWRRIRIGAVEFTVAKPCSRCVMPSINQRTGAKDSEILKVLAGYRRGEGGKVYFGQNLLYAVSGRLSLGDSVEVLE